jgi:hypothetical protein
VVERAPRRHPDQGRHYDQRNHRRLYRLDQCGEQGIFPIKSVLVAGQTMVINADHPEGPIEVRLTFVANDFNGSWKLGDQTGEMVGKRRP